ncbi:hypothetical protein RhiirA4_478538 [Rhizophagus irregularis]|uniref:Uncharacterized protein n=1 Tax=Rhizophagus irregularis TaxID=588596 RepID=A0A2I1HF57_9GLOM|nr:hypothetical protein RhiirA4_478538 [Rhizophagus irregularis]
MFDPDLSPQELRNRYGWQACKKISIERNATDGEIFKENITKYGGFFGKMTWGRATIEKSRRTRDSLTDPKEYFNDKIENFSELNEVLAVELMKLALKKLPYKPYSISTHLNPSINLLNTSLTPSNLISL